MPQTPRFDRLSLGDHAGGQMVFRPRESFLKPLRAKAPGSILLPPIRPEIGFPAVPFKGLRWFEEADAKVFFGRSREIRDMFQLLDNSHDARQRLILLYGPSGAGKSSFLNAGLLPRLHAHWHWTYARRGRDGHATAILQRFSPRLAEKSVLVIDQLEEVFSNPDPWRDIETVPFRTELMNMLSQNPGLTVVLSFREEYLGRILNLLDQPEDVYTRVAINHLDRRGMVEAITGAALLSGQDLFQGLSLEDEELPYEIAVYFSTLDAKTYTPLLQYLLLRMWKEASGGDQTPIVFTRELFSRLKKDTAEELVEAQLEEMGKHFPNELSSGLLDDLLYRLVTDDLTARSLPLQSINDIYSHISEDRMALILRAMENNFLLLGFTDREEVFRYRLSHDALARAVVQRYNRSEAPGQKAERYLAHALRTGEPLSKDALLTIEEGAPGRKTTTAEEEIHIRSAWKRHLKTIVGEEIGKNELEAAIAWLKKYQDMVEIVNMGVLLQWQLVRLKENYINGILSLDNYLAVRRKLQEDMISYVDGLFLEERKNRLSEILTSIISGEFPADQIDSFLREEDPGSALKFRDFSGLLEELQKLSRWGVIDTPSFLYNHATTLFAFIQGALKQYYFPATAERPVLSTSEMLGLIHGGFDKFVAPNDFAQEAAGLILENAEKITGDELLLPRLLLATALLNLSAAWTKAGILTQEKEFYIPANIADALKRHFQPPVFREKLPEGLHFVHLLELIFNNRLEEVFFIMRGESMHPDIEFLRRFLESPPDLGLFLLTFDDYRIKRNQFADSLIKLLDEKFHFLPPQDGPPKKPDENYLNEFREKAASGLLTGAFEPIGELLQRKWYDFNAILIAGSIERDIEDRINGHLILDEEAKYWNNRVKAIIFQHILEIEEPRFEWKYEIPEQLTLDDILTKVVEGELGTSLAYLARYVEDRGLDMETQNVIIMLTSRFNSMEKDRSQGTIRNEEYSTLFAQIVHDLVEIVDRIRHS